MKKIKIEKPNETGEQVASHNASSSPPLQQPQTVVAEGVQQLDESHDSLLGASPKKLSVVTDHPFKDQPDMFNSESGLLIESNKSILQQQPQQQHQLPLQNTPPQQQQQTQAFTGRSLPPGAPANYCNICNKELCNKYFMKTHMQKMHGINLDDLPREAANSGGVVCDICQKELCSKYFLKVHKSNTHGITDFSSSTAGSQAASAVTAVALTNALTNYSLNNAQKRAAINLALNQHQLQNRQAAALMNAAASAAASPNTFSSHLQIAQAANAAAMQQRDQQLYASSLINQIQQQQQHHQQQQNTKLQAHHQHQSATLPIAQHQLDLRLHQQQQTSKQQQQLLQQSQPQAQPMTQIPQGIPPEAGLAIASSLTSNFPASLLAATVTNPLLAAQLAQQQFPLINHIPSATGTTHQHRRQSKQQLQSYFGTNETSLVDAEDDTSDRDSLGDHSSADLQQPNQQNRCFDMNNFHEQLQNQQALLNATAVFNPAAAAAVMVAMHHHQQQQQQQQQHQTHIQQQRNQERQNLISAPTSLMQPMAIDLRNQQSPLSQLLAQKMLETAGQHSDERHHQLLVTNNCNNEDLLSATAQIRSSPLDLLDKCPTQENLLSPNSRFTVHQEDERLNGGVEEEEGLGDVEDVEEHVDSDRESTSYQADEGDQLPANTRLPTPSHPSSASLASLDIPLLDNTTDRVSKESSLNQSGVFSSDQPVNCAANSKRGALKSNNNASIKKLKQSQNLKSQNSKSKAQLEHLGSSSLRLDASLSTKISNHNHQSTTDHPPSVNHVILSASSVQQQQPSRTGAATSTNSQISGSNMNNGGVLQPNTNNAANNNNNNNNNNNSNSRYLRHYTEACPICERRFKSIKWLQSHVMNDHKNEIGNLFNLLLQVLLCGNGGAESNGETPEPPGALGGPQQSLNPSLVSSLLGAGSGGCNSSALDISQYLAGILNVAKFTQQQHPATQTIAGSPLTPVGLTTSTPPQGKPTNATSAVINNRGDA